MLQIGNDLKQVAGGWIAVWAKHLMKSLYVDLGMRGQLGKADCGIDVITQQLFAKRHFAREKAFQCIAQKPSSKGGITFRIRLNCLSEISRQSHFYSSSFCCFFLCL